MGPRLKVSSGGMEKDGIELMTPFFTVHLAYPLCALEDCITPPREHDHRVAYF